LIESGDAPASVRRRSAGRRTRHERQADGYLGRDALIHNHQLMLLDNKANSKLTGIMDRLSCTPDDLATHLTPVVVRRPAKRRLLIQALPVPVTARNPFLGTRAVLVVKDLDIDVTCNQDLMISAFELGWRLYCRAWPVRDR
jgi:hypothetical protein